MADSVLDSSFDGQESVDLTSVIAEFPHNDDYPGKMIPKKKLSQEFEGCIKSDEFMKVFLRIRPISSKTESTIIAESDTSILTTAPESSRRAQVKILFVFISTSDTLYFSRAAYHYS
jgi:hypothetical protein